MLFALFSHLPLTWCSLSESCSAQQRPCAPASKSKEARAARFMVVPQPLLEAKRVDLPEHLLAALLSQVWVEVQMVHDLSSLRPRLPTSQEAYGGRRPAVMSRASRLSRELLSCIVPAPLREADRHMVRRPSNAQGAVTPVQRSRRCHAATRKRSPLLGTNWDTTSRPSRDTSPMTAGHLSL